MTDEAEQLAATPTLEAKVAFLRSPAAYPDCPARVDAIETHMSWVFLTDGFAYKLKKPIRRNTPDYGTLDKRLLNCRREVELNRRLAPDVYLDVVPLTLDADESEQMRLGGDGQPVEWLVKMRRLHEELTLQHAIVTGRCDDDAVRRAAGCVAAFFRDAPIVATPEREYRSRFETMIRETRAELQRPEYGLREDLLDGLTQTLLGSLSADADLIGARARHVIEGHGDLRPEHIYLGAQPLVTDCLEFERALRLRDPLDELAFLALECERLGAAAIGAGFIAAYAAAANDAFPPKLVDFYVSCNAYLRIKLAIWHIDEPGVRDGAKWRERARCYLELGLAHAAKLQ